MATIEARIQTEDGERQSNYQCEVVYQFSDLESPQLPKIVKGYAKEMLKWLDPKYGWKPFALVVSIDHAQGLPQDINSYLENGPSENPPQDFNIYMVVTSPNPPKRGILPRIIDIKRSMAGNQQDKKFIIKSSIAQAVILTLTDESVFGIYGEEKTLTFHSPVSPHYFKNAYISTEPMYNEDFEPIFKTNNSLYLSLTLGDCFDLWAKRSKATLEDARTAYKAKAWMAKEAKRYYQHKT